MSYGEMLKKLESNRLHMIQLSRELRSINSNKNYSRVIVEHLIAIEENLVTINWAIKRIVAPLE